MTQKNEKVDYERFGPSARNTQHPKSKLALMTNLYYMAEIMWAKRFAH